MGFARKIKSYFGRAVERKKDISRNRYTYGNDNKLPQELINLVSNNATARRCIKKKSNYIEADGFTEEDLNRQSVNKNFTAQQLLKETAQSVSFFEGFAWLIFRSGAGKIAGVKSLPFECIRKSLDDEPVYEYNKNYGTKDYKESETKYYPGFQGDKIDSGKFAEIKAKFQKLNKNTADYPGEILYMYERDAISFHYPIPTWFTGEEDIKTGSELAKVDADNAKNAFMPSVILTYVGKIDDQTKDADGKTEEYYFDEKIKDFSGQNRAEDGTSGVGKVLFFNVETEAQKPQIDTIDVEKIITGTIAKREAIDRIVCRNFSVHPVLLGFDDGSVLGNQQALSNAANELCNDVKSLQSMIERAFKMVYPERGWTITKFTPFVFIPDKFIDVLTADEKRGLIGFLPLKKEAADV